MGNAITEKQHAEDIKIILDVGANSVRLAHYQQNSYFYDLCDESGLLVWAEVPVISRFSPKRNENMRYIVRWRLLMIFRWNRMKTTQKGRRMSK